MKHMPSVGVVCIYVISCETQQLNKTRKVQSGVELGIGNWEFSSFSSYLVTMHKITSLQEPLPLPPVLLSAL